MASFVLKIKDFEFPNCPLERQHDTKLLVEKQMNIPRNLSGLNILSTLYIKRLCSYTYIQGLKLRLTDWLPIRPKIECWRLDFQNWSPAGKSRFV